MDNGCCGNRAWPFIRRGMEFLIRLSVVNTTFTPVSSKSKADPIIILWISSSYNFSKTWLPNHFVPLVSTGKDSMVIDLDSLEDFPPLNSTIGNTSCNACPTMF